MLVLVFVLVSVLLHPSSGGPLHLIYERSSVHPEPTEPDRTRQKRQYRDPPLVPPSTISKSSSYPDIPLFYSATETPFISSTHRRYTVPYSGLYPTTARHLFHQNVHPVASACMRTNHSAELRHISIHTPSQLGVNAPIPSDRCSSHMAGPQIDLKNNHVGMTFGGMLSAKPLNPTPQ
jgi:hypothetical protein